MAVCHLETVRFLPPGCAFSNDIKMTGKECMSENKLIATSLVVSRGLKM